MDLEHIRALLIDIDDTITRLKTDRDGKPVAAATSSSLFTHLEDAAVARGLPRAEAARRIAGIQKDMRWWHWSDFIVALELDPVTFWDYAYEKESQYLEATGPEIRPALERLHRAGLLLYITSNNPSSGILHKLRLAGLGHVNGAPLFHQILGPPEMQAMKWEDLYWRKALAHIALRGSEVAVVGDTFHDDYEMPRAAGLAGTFLINRREDLSAQDTESLVHVQDFTRIADLVLAARRPAKPRAKGRP